MTEIITQSVLLQNYKAIINGGLAAQIGNTPLIPISREMYPDVKADVEIFAKAEWFNPGGSVKDRPAWSMIRQGIIEGDLTPDKSIIDASSGNTGIALAMIGASLGVSVTICIPSNASKERFRLLRAYGAEIIKTDPLEGTDGAILKVQEIIQNNPEKYYYTDQYNNEANWKAHYETTAPEIIRQTNGEITHFITGLGTSGTFIGTTRRLREEINDVSCISLQPDAPFHGLEGLKHMESAITPGIYDETLANSNVSVSTTIAQDVTVKLAKNHGILVGVSSGANLAGAIEVAKNLDQGKIVTIFCDHGERYLDDKIWEETA